MPLISRDADLNTCPKPVEHNATHVSIGDMHGNALKLIYCLVEDGFIKLDENSYNILRDIYNTPVEALTKDHIQQFQTILHNAEINNHIALTLIGDELADRGNNDYFTLLVLQKLQRSNVNFNILLSNHSAAFIEDYDKKEFTGKAGFAAGQAVSLSNMHTLIKKGIITEQEVRGIVQESYVPAIKAINYTFSKETGELTLFTHAPVGLETIKSLAQYFQIEYKDSSVLALTTTIDAINARINTLFQEKKLGTEITRAFIIGERSQQQVNEEIHKALSGMEVPVPKQAPLQRLVWNRYMSAANEIETQPTGGFKVNFVHGHIGAGALLLNGAAVASHENLDTYFGKSRQDFKTGGDVTHLVRHSHDATEKELKNNRFFLLRDVYLKQLQHSIDAFAEKIIELETKGILNPKYKKVAQKATPLLTTIRSAHTEFQKNPSINNLKIFHETCENAIKMAMPEFKKNRGVGDTLVAILNCIRKLLHQTPITTDSIKKAQNFKEELQNFKDKYEKDFPEQQEQGHSI